MKKSILMLSMIVAASANAGGYNNSHDHDIEVFNENQNYTEFAHDSDDTYQHYSISAPPAATNYYGHGVGCSKPTIWGGLVGGDDDTVGYVGITIALGAGECSSAASRAKTLQEGEIALQRGQLAIMCEKLHKTVWASDDELHKVCDQFQPTHGHPPSTKAASSPHQRRVSHH
jgi:hypothetical protein